MFYALDTSNISQAKGVNKVFNILDDIVKFVGEKSVIQVIIDNGINFKVVGELLIQNDNIYIEFYVVAIILI